MIFELEQNCELKQTNLIESMLAHYSADKAL